MASSVLYPPIVDNFLPAFVAEDNAVCKVYFSLSKFNSSDDFKTVHVAIYKQDSGLNIVNKEDSNDRYRKYEDYEEYKEVVNEYEEADEVIDCDEYKSYEESYD